MAVSILPRLVAVLYLRMSSPKQDASIPAQREALVAYAKKRGIKIIREYVDEAISGDDTENREAFQRLRQDAETFRDFSIILCWDGDRFSRNDVIEYGFWAKPIRDLGIVVETPQGVVDWDTLNGRVILAIEQEMRHQYLQNLSRNVSRGFVNAAKNPRGTGGSAPKGYLRDRDKVVVDPVWAAIILRIFVEYLKPGASLRSVAKLLNAEGIRSVTGRKWSAITVRSTLMNRKYTGDFVRFQRRCGKYHAIQDGEIVPRSKGDGTEIVDPLVVEDHHEAIVPRDIFDAAQKKLGLNLTNKAHRTARQYAFSGLLKCGDCGGPMHGVPGNTETQGSRYRCGTAQKYGRSACQPSSIAEDKLVNAVARLLDEYYLGDEALDRMEGKIRKRLAENHRRKTAVVDTDRLRKRISDLDRRIDQGAERIFSAPEDLVQTLYGKLNELRSERDRLRQDLDAAGRQDGGPDDEAVVAEALGYLRDLGRQIREAEAEERRDLFRQVISRIELHFTHRQKAGKGKHDFSHGTIFVRPDPVLSIMFITSRSF